MQHVKAFVCGDECDLRTVFIKSIIDSMTIDRERADTMMQTTMHKVKCDFLQALGEVAEELGGEAFADEALTASATNSNVPGAAGYAKLHERFPDAISVVHACINEISTQRREVEQEAILEQMQPRNFRVIGQRVLRGFSATRFS